MKKHSLVLPLVSLLLLAPKLAAADGGVFNFSTADKAFDGAQKPTAAQLQGFRKQVGSADDQDSDDQYNSAGGDGNSLTFGSTVSARYFEKVWVNRPS